MSRHGDWGPRPRSEDHEDHSKIEPIRDLAERAVTGGTAADYERMMAQAEMNLASLKQEFPAWMASELADLETALTNYKSGVPDGAKLFFRKAHDMRGQAATFGYPLAGRAADCLCKLMDALERVPDDVIETHMNAIRIIIKMNINVVDHPVGTQMIDELEKLGYKLIRSALRLV
ncbi:MAG: hypothetical protein ACOVN4_00230 [Bosea sp. (in: a-proteobacteria)]|jgi:hypothetical protein